MGTQAPVKPNPAASFTKRLAALEEAVAALQIESDAHSRALMGTTAEPEPQAEPVWGPHFLDPDKDALAQLCEWAKVRFRNIETTHHDLRCVPASTVLLGTIDHVVMEVWRVAREQPRPVAQPLSEPLTPLAPPKLAVPQPGKGTPVAVSSAINTAFLRLRKECNDRPVRVGDGSLYPILHECCLEAYTAGQEDSAEDIDAGNYRAGWADAMARIRQLAVQEAGNAPEDIEPEREGV